MRAKTRKGASIGDPNARIVMYSNPHSETGASIGNPNARIVMLLNPPSETGQAACDKCTNGEKQHNPIARIEILFVSQFVNLCVPFLMRRMSNLFSVNSRTERK
jgi:hypothetical protein